MMKHLQKLFVLCVSVCMLTSCYQEWWERIEILESNVTNHEARIQALEALCKRLNTNVTNLQVLVDSYECHAYITAVQEFDNDGSGKSGCVIVFSNGKIITLYNGTDAATPVISARADGSVWYWTVNGEWLLDENGQRVCCNGSSSASYAVRHLNSNANSRLRLAEGQWSICNDEVWSSIGMGNEASHILLSKRVAYGQESWAVSFDNISWNSLALAEGADREAGEVASLTLQANGVWLADDQVLGRAIGADGRVCANDIQMDMVNGYLFADYGFGLNPIPGGKIHTEAEETNAIIPQLYVDENDNWTISYDNGLTWESVAKVEALESVVVDNSNPNYVNFTLANETISIPRASAGAMRIPVEQVIINDNNLTLHIGEEYNLTATVFPLNATFPGVLWKSSNEQVASVSYLTGLTTALTAGETIISASADGQICTYQIKITVVE